MQFFANLVLYILISLGLGYALRSFKDEEGVPKLKWYITGILIGLACGVANALASGAGLPFWDRFWEGLALVCWSVSPLA